MTFLMRDGENLWVAHLGQADLSLHGGEQTHAKL
jgi:hypothetical protein